MRAQSMWVMNMTGKKLKELRESKNLTQPKLALMIGAGYRTIVAWESGERPINGISETALLSVLLSK